MNILLFIILLYVAVLVDIIAHEIGHIPRKGIHITSWFPLPAAVAEASVFRYGGLLVNFLIFFLVFKYQPQMLFLKLLGIVSFIHFILYTIMGSINNELKFAKVKDDIPNDLAYVFIPIGIVTLYYFGPYFLEVIKTIL